ncbi:MAG: WD40 repeat domain-containing protein [Cyanobacteria bacterium P01_A01_bin.114]
MPKQILTQLSTQVINLGSGDDQFKVTVNNLSDRFATFALELSASGLDRQTVPDWYRLTPDLSAKIPAGDQVNFVVTILEVPPIAGGFTGKMNLNVNVTCLELGEEDRQLVNLVVAGSGALPPILQVPHTDFQVDPGSLIEIPLQLHNPNRNTANLRVVIKGLPSAWLTDGYERRLQVAPQASAHALFMCQPPLSSEAKEYPFDIEVSHTEAPLVRQQGSLTILPTGWVEFKCKRLDQRAEEKPAESDANVSENSLSEDRLSTHYALTLNNRSNVGQTVALTLARIDVPWYERLWARVRRRPPTPALTTSHGLLVSPAQVDLKAGDFAQMSLTVLLNPPWLGWRRRQQFQLRPQLQQTDMRPRARTIELVVNPKIPFWLQCLGLGCLGMAVILPTYWQAGHRGPVNSVQFDGQANAVISAADDHTIRRWQVFPHLQDVDILTNTDKAVRVVRYRPLNNDLLAAGLENGEIQLWDFLSQQSPKSLVFQRDDRVFDLEFSRDSQSLFSAHGSGLVLRWAIKDRDDLGEQTVPQQQRQFGFAIQSIALVEAPNRFLAVGGRFNKLVLWDFEKNQQFPINYPAGEPNHYLSSLDTAAASPSRLVTADNQGRITLWDLASCLESSAPCQPTDQWTDGHQGRPVNAVALSKNACHLVSGGDDGRVMLWSLNTAGQVMRKRVLARFRHPVNSVDIMQQGQTLMIVSGSDSHRVKLHRTQDKNKICS